MNPLNAIVASLLLSSSVALAQTTRATPAAEDAPTPRPTVTRVYDVRDMAMTVQNFPYTGKIGMPQERPAVVSTGEEKPEEKPTPALSREQRIQDVVQLITETVDSDSWRENGGQVGAVRVINGMLVVAQTPENHQAIAGLLGQLREHDGVVRVQADWVLLEPAQAAALLAPGSGGGTARRSATQPAVKVIDPAALAKLPEQAVHYRGEISCFTGQTVSISSGGARSIIYSGEPVVAQSAAAMSPDVRQVQSGAMLEITPTVLRDAGFAVVELHTRVAEIQPGERTTLVQASTQPSGSMIGIAGPDGIDKLQMDVQELRSSLRVPLDQPVLVGGMTFSPTRREPKGTQLYLILQISSASATP